jgi:hypothetical protein
MVKSAPIRSPGRLTRIRPKVESAAVTTSRKARAKAAASASTTNSWTSRLMAMLRPPSTGRAARRSSFAVASGVRVRSMLASW